ncbi:uncharacterized protein [Watersipora subatra]|uniref:uncharacterized protein n=1 Tax=Watersipora subatra TaxID=2589382 RepID=UPI00355C7ADF
MSESESEPAESQSADADLANDSILSASNAVHSLVPESVSNIEVSVRKSTRTKTLSSVAKQNKCLELNTALYKQINKAQVYFDTVYNNFEQLTGLDVANNTLETVDAVVQYVNELYDELYELSDNKVDLSVSKQFDEYVEEVSVLKDQVNARIKLLMDTKAEEIAEEQEITRLEESIAKMKEELEKQNRIYESRKADRAAIQRRAFSHPKELSTSVGSQRRSSVLDPQRDNSEEVFSHKRHSQLHSLAFEQQRNNFDEVLSHQPPQLTPIQGATVTNQDGRMPIQRQDDGMSAVRELTQSLVTAMKATKRSTPAPTIYDGNPINFQDWEQDFEAYIESEGLVGKEPLRYLKKIVTGKAKDAISGHLMTNTEAAYKAARCDLKERFRSKHTVNRALRKKLDEWPRVGAKDAKALRDYADFLSHLRAAMSDVPELQSLDLSQENEKMAAKLPDWMIRNWARKVKERRQDEYRYPTFAEFVHFVVDQAEVMDEPLMKNLGGNRDNPRKQKAAPSSNTKVFTTTLSAKEKEQCKYCKKIHLTTECFSLAKLSDEDKDAFVKGNRLCYGCLDTGHQSKQCPQKATCKSCTKRHPTVFHKNQFEWKPRKSAVDPPEKEETKVVEKGALPKEETRKLTTKTTRAGKMMLSMVIPVYVSTLQNPSEETLIYAMLDTQSDSSYLSKEIAHIVKPAYSTETVTISTLTGETTEWVKRYSNLRIRGYQQIESTTLEAYEWSELLYSGQQIPNSVNVQHLPHLKEHAYKLPPPLDIPIGILIGADCVEAFEPLECIPGDKGQPFAQRTILGWTVLGGKEQLTTVEGKLNQKTKVNATSVCFKDHDETTLISQEDIKFMNIMHEEALIKENGSYEMPLPFRQRPIMPNNKVQAEKRLMGLKKKFGTNETFRKEYTTFMADLIEKGHAEEVLSSGEKIRTGEVWYIPHFAVVHPKKNKIRVVFDCSAKFDGTSLNDHLLQGPDLFNNMLGILLRFREEPVAIACDVERMFYNFQVNADDRNYLRFLWFGNSGEIKQYRMTVHLFGATSSPAVATYGLQTLAESHKKTYPTASQFIQKNFYVDDGITSVPTVEEALELIESSRKLCQKGNLRLHKFVSNNAQVLKGIPESERSVKDVDLYNGCFLTQRTLGLEWSMKEDLLKFTAKEFQPKPMTRRGVLSTVSQLYDSLGFLAPFSLKGKNILQKINKVDDDWNKEIPPGLIQPWKEWVKELGNLDDVLIPRCIKPTDFGPTAQAELHHFFDASLSGIGACSYMRLIDINGNVHTCLLLAKSRVVPSKGIITVPRLELQGAVVATQLHSILKKELNIKVNQEHFWTDSEIVLAYLSNEKKKFHVYVANRVREIKMTTKA